MPLLAVAHQVIPSQPPLPRDRILGRDQSGASRMVRDATTAGYLTRATSPRDRRTVLTLTLQGQALLASSRQWQRQAKG